MEDLSLSEKVYLLAIRPEKGGFRVMAGNSFNYLLTGACLLELFLLKKIAFHHKRIEILDSGTDTDLHRFLMEKLSVPRRPKKIASWLSRFQFSHKIIRGYIADSLVRQKQLRLADRSFLFFRWKRPELLTKRLLYHILEDLHRAAFQGSDNPDDYLLLSLIETGPLWSRVFPERHQRKQARLRIRQIRENNQFPAALAEAIKASAAVAVSVNAATATNLYTSN